MKCHGYNQKVNLCIYDILYYQTNKVGEADTEVDIEEKEDEEDTIQQLGRL